VTHQIFPQPVRSYATVRQRTTAHEYVYWRPDNATSAQQSSRGRASRLSCRRYLTDVLLPIAGLVAIIAWLCAGGTL
jgi:hypothetical protein